MVLRTLGGILVGILVAGPVTWALTGIWSHWFQGWEVMDFTQMRIALLLIILTALLFRSLFHSPPPSRR